MSSHLSSFTWEHESSVISAVSDFNSISYLRFRPQYHGELRFSDLALRRQAPALGEPTAHIRARVIRVRPAGRHAGRLRHSRAEGVALADHSAKRRLTNPAECSNLPFAPLHRASRCRVACRIREPSTAMADHHCPANRRDFASLCDGANGPAPLSVRAGT